MPRRERPSEVTRSERWMRVAANAAAETVNRRIRSSFGWSEAESIKWCSPAREDDYAEYYDDEFLTCLGISDLEVALADFWPKSGPRWDGLACTDSGKLLLIEAKAYPEEAVDGSSGAGPRSLAKIKAALAEAQEAFGASREANWLAPFYQYANRLAHLHFLAGANSLDAYLVFLNFADAEDVPNPCSIEEWKGASRVIERCLGLPRRHRYSDRIAKVTINTADLQRGVQ